MFDGHAEVTADSGAGVVSDATSYMLRWKLFRIFCLAAEPLSRDNVRHVDQLRDEGAPPDKGLGFRHRWHSSVGDGAAVMCWGGKALEAWFIRNMKYNIG